MAIPVQIILSITASYIFQCHCSRPGLFLGDDTEGKVGPNNRNLFAFLCHPEATWQYLLNYSDPLMVQEPVMTG